MSIKKTLLFVLTLVFTITTVSCSSFVKEEDMPVLKKLEGNTYVLKKDVKIEQFQLFIKSLIKRMFDYAQSSE